ncbi:SpoIIE family protein phosphatase [Rhodocaloribacter litoris]|uniref:PP2C family protein-serine/threonine phosphatase n=1 Tax=Rhodocaloribacter litoris TaxID=2558931 RepID=UPI001420E9E6|nr:GAF domain-containing SpoIIE family protein phosphatase [Rhodocaloribacter litoris]QXD16489.1 SpoIIE family protein phosphatase [Rhodocaloribacter litoris]GIV59456.1 MAG: hypothetical protein KatS3mg043_0545 [Rhodothermaceae bacterium]
MDDADPNGARLKALQHENARLRRAVEELSLLNDLAREIGSAHGIQAIMHTIIRRSLKAVRAEQGVITLVGAETDDPSRTLIRTSASSGEHPSYRAEGQLLGWMHLHRKPLLINDPAGDPRFRGTAWPPGIRSILCVPLLAQSHLVGVLTVYNKKGGARFDAEDQRLLTILAAQSAQIIENARLYEEEQHLQRLREEYRLAHEIQQYLLPDEPPELPGYDLAGLTRPATEVGGDYYDTIPMDAHRVALCVADVSGKGLPAAMLMANVQATLRSQSLQRRAPPREIIRNANRLLCRSIRKGTFVTLFFAVLDLRTHRLTYVNAGHNRPLLRTAGGRLTELGTGGIVLGFMPEFDFEEDTIPFGPGDTLLAYSDGITEAMNADREPFETEALAALLHRHAGEPARCQIEQYLAAADHHAGHAAQSDDMTLLVLRRRPHT